MTTLVRTSAGHVTWDGRQLLEALSFASQLLSHHRDRVNAMNVFPIPDGDTGTNMGLTMTGSLDIAVKAHATDTVAHLADRFAYGALMAARGNSGVILSQIWRGFANGLQGVNDMTGADLGNALEAASDKAYKAVMRPVEGTMLTVIRYAAEDAKLKATSKSSVTDVLEAALEGAKRALEETPQLLDILRQAGVVDAGGQGVVYLLDGMYRFALGNTTIDEESTIEQVGAEMDFLDDVAELHGEDPFGYCTNFMVFGESIDFPTARDTFNDMGQSVVAVGDETVVKVHIHTENPGEVLAYALTLGHLDQIKIDNMTLQTEELRGQRTAVQNDSTSDRPSWAGCDIPLEIHGDTGIIAVAAGEGLAQALLAMGANLIVRGGQTMNPSTEDLYQAVEALPASNVIILPNNKNIILAAQQVTDLTEKTVRVVPSKSLPDGLTALTTFGFDDDIESNTKTMTAAMENVVAIEFTVAVRDAVINGVDVKEGQFIGLIEGDLVSSGADLESIAATTLRSLENADPELLTVFIGTDATEDHTATLEHLVADMYPDAEIEVVEGNQPHYLFIIAVE
jgi:uncharacterized protein